MRRETTPRSRLLRSVGLVATGLLVCLVVAVYLYYPAKGVLIRTFGMPAIVHQPFIVEFQEESGLRQCAKFFESWQARSAAGLHRRVRTVEGDSLDLWAITQNGRLTLVTDFTRDSFSDRVIVVEHPLAVAARLFRDLHDFHDFPPDPLRAWFPSANEPYLLFTLEHEKSAFF